MSHGPHGDARGPPPPLEPPLVPPGHLIHIPEQERSFNYCQPRQPSPHTHPTTSLIMAKDSSGLRGSLPPPVTDCQTLFTIPHHHGNPPPMFSRPPPAPPPVHSQPPISRTPNVPLQPPSWSPVRPFGHCNTSWSQQNPPPAPQWCQTVGETGPSFPVAPPAVPEGVARVNALLQEEEKDSKWLQEFERRVKLHPPPPSFPNATKKVKLAEVQRLVVEAYSLKEQLCALEEELTKVSDSADEVEWNRLVQQTEEIKVKLQKIQETFRNEEFIECTRILLRQRRAKRKRVKRRKEELQLEKEETKKRRQEVETEIDAWREKLQREEDSKRREEAVKREADSVLSEVRQKQHEGHRMLQLLEALATLRHTRATQAAAQGQPKDVQAEQRFTTTTEMMSKIVKQQLKEYELEEQTLCVMMEESASHRLAALSAKQDANVAHYAAAVRKVLFGPTAADAQDDDHSLETLVQRRYEWDQFVVDGDHPLASAIPLSWVLPPAQPDPSWAAFLKR